MSPLDWLYIVLAFCALWLTAGVFWLVWQIATIFRTANEAISEARETMSKIEMALSGIKQKFDSTTGMLALVVGATSKVVDHLLDKKKAPSRPKRSRKKKKENIIDV